MSSACPEALFTSTLSSARGERTRRNGDHPGPPHPFRRPKSGGWCVSAPKNALHSHILPFLEVSHSTHNYHRRRVGQGRLGCIHHPRRSGRLPPGCAHPEVHRCVPDELSPSAGDSTHAMAQHRLMASVSTTCQPVCAPGGLRSCCSPSFLAGSVVSASASRDQPSLFARCVCLGDSGHSQSGRNGRAGPFQPRHGPQPRHTQLKPLPLLGEALGIPPSVSHSRRVPTAPAVLPCRYRAGAGLAALTLAATLQTATVNPAVASEIDILSAPAPTGALPVGDMGNLQGCCRAGTAPRPPRTALHMSFR